MRVDGVSGERILKIGRRRSTAVIIRRAADFPPVFHPTRKETRFSRISRIFRAVHVGRGFAKQRQFGILSKLGLFSPLYCEVFQVRVVLPGGARVSRVLFFVIL